MKRLRFYFCLAILPVIIECRPRSCYDIKLQFGNDSKLVTNSPILIGDGIVGYVENLQTITDGSEVIICMPNSIKIPKDSKLLEGYIHHIGNGIQINLGTKNDFLSSDDILVGVHKDSIEFQTNQADSAMVKKVMEIVHGFAEKAGQKEN